MSFFEDLAQEIKLRRIRNITDEEKFFPISSLVWFQEEKDGELRLRLALRRVEDADEDFIDDGRIRFVERVPKWYSVEACLTPLPSNKVLKFYDCETGEQLIGEPIADFCNYCRDGKSCFYVFNRIVVEHNNDSTAISPSGFYHKNIIFAESFDKNAKTPGTIKEVNGQMLSYIVSYSPSNEKVGDCYCFSKSIIENTMRETNKKLEKRIENMNKSAKITAKKREEASKKLAVREEIANYYKDNLMR